MKLGNPQAVGELMRARRKEMGFTIEQMAEAVGLSPITIMRLELGRVGYIHKKTAKALEVPKKLTRRLEADSNAVVPIAVTHDNEHVALPPLSLLTRTAGYSAPKAEGQKTLESGDAMAYVSPSAKHSSKEAEKRSAAPKQESILKRVLLSLANKL